MKQQIILTGIVLSVSLIGDFDKRVVILTKERGKITAFAKGVRRPGSPLMAVCQPFTFGKFTVYEGFDAYRLIQAEVEDYFTELKEDLEGICYGTYFCEFVDYLTVENNCNKQVLGLLYASLRALTKKIVEYPLIRYVFEIKILALEGQGMHCFSCVKCGEETPLIAFDSESGGLLCPQCKGKGKSPVLIQESTVYTLQYVISSPLEKLYSFRVSEAVLKELSRICVRYREQYVGKNFKSLEILDTLS